VKIITHFESPFSNFLQRRFDPENAYRKTPVILKVVPEAGYDTYIEEIDQ
jgi:hypothetical protein